MSKLLSAGRGVGQGLWVALVWVWAMLNKYGDWALAQTKLDTGTRRAALLLNMVSMGGMIALAWEVIPSELIGFALALTINILFVWPVLTWTLEKLVDGVQVVHARLF